jgi:hypothetical protein
MLTQQEESFIQDILCNNWGGSIDDITDSESSEDLNLLCDTDSEDGEKQDGNTIDEMIKLDYKTLTDLIILKYQSHIIGHLRKYTKNIIDNETDMTLFETKRFLEKIKWLHETSNYLTEKHGLKKYSHKYNGEPNLPIPRSSYKFCNNGHECKFNYDTGKKTCFAHHYVYNMVLADTNALIMHLEKNTNIKLDQIMICMNTITFVINHMYNEMHNWENCQKAIRLLESTRSSEPKKFRQKRSKRQPAFKDKDGWMVVGKKSKPYRFKKSFKDRGRFKPIFGGKNEANPNPMEQGPSGAINLGS